MFMPLVGLFAALSIGGIPAALAGAGPPCTQCEDDYFIGPLHRFGDGANYLGTPNPVHGSWQNGWCSQFHAAGCGGLTLFLDGGGLDRLERLIADGDFIAVRALITESSFITVNTSRGAVQVRDCDGGVIAHYEVGAAGTTALLE